MDITKALKIVENYGDSWGYPALLETLQGMHDAYQRDELNDQECRAFRVVWNQFSRLLATV